MKPFLLALLVTALAAPPPAALDDSPPGADRRAGEKEMYGRPDQIPGAGGFLPQLLANGSLRGDTPGSRIRLQHGLGGSRAWLLVGNAPGPIEGPRGIRILVSNLLGIFRLPLDGEVGEPGQGSFELPLRLGPSFQDVEVYLQAFVFDPSAEFGLSSSNGLRLAFGGRNVQGESARPGR